MPSHKHALIFQSLLNNIQAGRLRPGDRLPSETALARKHHVSRPTAAHALRELQRLDLVERHPGSGTFVRPAKAKAQGSLVLVTDGLGRTEILGPLSAELGRIAQARGWALTVAVHALDEDPENLVRAWVERDISGVFFAPVEHHPIRAALNRTFAERVLQHGLRLVLLDRDLAEYPERSLHDLVSVDDFIAGVHLGLHLYKGRRRRIAFVARPEYPPTTDLRLAGVREAAQRSGAPPVGFFSGDPREAKWVRSVLSQSRCDGIICANDATAAETLQTLRQLGRSVPSDVALAGFDDVTYATLLSPPLTTMRQPCAQLAEVAMETMLSRLAHPSLAPRRILISATLVARESTG